MIKTKNLGAIHDNIYKRNFNLVVNISNEDFLADLKKHHAGHRGLNKVAPLLIDGCKGLCAFDFNPYIYVYIREFNWEVSQLGVLHHEINHFVDFVLNYVGIKADLKNTEVRAYYYEYIYVKISRELRRLIKYESKPQAKAKGNKARSNGKGKKTRKRSTNTS